MMKKFDHNIVFLKNANFSAENWRKSQKKLIITSVPNLALNNVSAFFSQVNKQGMADRVVDDSNPEARLSSKEIQKLICDDEDDPPPYCWDLQASLEHLYQADPGMSGYTRSFQR
jgi:hypothetical protein